MTYALKRPIPFSVKLRRQSAIISRWLHLYLSMVSFAVVLFFAVTGLTLNHADWFAGQVRESRYSGSMPMEWLRGAQPNQLAIAEKLRTAHGIHGAVSDFRADDPISRRRFNMVRTRLTSALSIAVNVTI